MRSIPVLVLFATLAAVLTSCSRIPTAPGADTPLGRGSATQSIGRVGDTPPPIDGQRGLINSITLPVGVGGTLKAGRWTLVIPKNSLKMGATITMIQPDFDVLEVEFEVTPAAANNFRAPAQLTADCSNYTLDELQNETMYWWGGHWLQAASVSLNSASRSLTTRRRYLANCKVDARGDSDRDHEDQGGDEGGNDDGNQGGNN